MKITIITVGKLKEKYLKQGIMTYVKELSKQYPINIIEVADEKAPEKLSVAQEIEVKYKEGQRIQQKIDPNAYIIALAIDGEMKSTNTFKKFLKQLKNQRKTSINFIIGGSLGLSEEVLSLAHGKLSFSKMTFPHQLMRLILVEQLHRALVLKSNDQ